MPPPSLRIPMSLNMADFQKNIDGAKSLTSTATKFITKQFIDMNASVLATQGATGAAVLGFRSLLGVLGPLSLAIGGIVGVFNLMGYATELAKEKIEEFNAIAEKAAKSNVSTDFFQRFTKSGEELRLTVDQVNAALERFNDSSRVSLGGSQLGQRVDELRKAGNFEGNAGVGALANADTTEARLRATVQLIREAFESGQRLAGLDIAKNAFGPEITDRLRQDATFLDQMLATAQKLSADKIVSDEQVGQAIQLKTRLEEAQKVLAEKFKPIQDDLAKLGVNYHESWIGVVETMSSAVSQANSLYAAIKRIPDVLADAGSSSFWTKLTEMTGKLGLNSDPKSLGIVFPGEPGFASDPARDKLAAGLNNPEAVRRAMQQASDVQGRVRGDTSTAPAKAQNDVADAYDRQIESLQKHTARLQADTQAVGLGVGALEEYRARTALLTAAQQAGIPVQGETAKQIDEIARAAGAAGEALAKARVASEIKFGAGTSFLTQEDVAIAQQLRAVYGDDIPAAMASSQAAALRLVDANREVASAISGNLTTAIADTVDGTKTAGQAFGEFAKTALRAIEEVVIKLLVVGPLMRSLQGGLGGLFGGGGSFATDGIGGFGPTAPIGFNAQGTDNWRGGPTWVGEKGPEIVNLPRGAQVIPNDIARQVGGGVSVPVNITMDARGADSAVEARFNGQLAQLRAELPAIVVSSVKQAQKGRTL